MNSRKSYSSPLSHLGACACIYAYACTFLLCLCVCACVCVCVCMFECTVFGIRKNLYWLGFSGLGQDLDRRPKVS